MQDFVLPKITEIKHLVGVDNAPAVNDVVISTDTYLQSDQDGEMVTLFAKNLTIEAGATLTVANRCKGLKIICFGDCNIYGKISMTARGANAVGEDVTIDIATQTFFEVKFPAEMRAIDRYLKNFFNPNNTFDDLPESIRPVITRTAVSGQTIGTVPAAGAAGASSPGTYSNGIAGTAGTSRKCGGGGSGAVKSTGTAGAGSAGTAFSGGSGGGASVTDNSSYPTNAYSATANGGAGGAGRVRTSGGSQGAGGGAGNPGGAGASYGGGVGYAGSSGTGGLLILIVLGTISIYSGGSIESKGSNGGNGSGSYTAGGGGSGGGSINIAYGVSYSNVGTVTAAGGSGGSGNYSGGAGGAGCVTVGQISL